MKEYSIVIPVFNEEENILQFINSLEKLNFFKEIIVVDNNSTDKSKELILSTSAKYLHQKIQGYGASLFMGLNEAKTDYIFTIEPDGTFEIDDIYNFIDKVEKYDCIFGTRTNKSKIEEFAKMGPFLRFGNIFVAKLLQFLFWTTPISDVGCTFKLIRKSSFEKIKNQLIKITNSTFQPYLMMLLFKEKTKIIEIPVKYKKRIGYSKITYNFTSSFALGIQMIMLIIKFYIISKIKK